jgi:nucleoside 2-deoxyribosyltransferase
MADRKVVFVAFAIEDVSQRDLLKGQSLHTRSPFDYVDMSVKEPYDREWEDRVRTRIRRSDGVIALVSKNTPNSSGELWEIGCAKEEGVPLIGLWAYTSDRTRPSALSGATIIEWTWAGIANFIDGL